MKRFGNVLVIIGLLLIAAALSLCIHNVRESLEAQEASDAIVEEMAEVISEKEKLPEGEDPIDMPTVEIDGYLYIGVLRIPELDLVLPVMEEWDYDRLKISPCRYVGTYMTNDLVICGHNYASHFSSIKNIAINTDVYFTTADGQEIHYIVSNREIVEPTSVKEMIGNLNNEEGTGDWDLTMFTCTVGGQTRCAVRCVRLTEE